MHIEYEPYRPSAAARALIDAANAIIEDYDAQGYDLTLRQLYYQFVARDVIENTERSYKNLGNIITKARMGGFISWEAIEDRTRTVHEFLIQTSERETFDGVEYGYARDMWADQQAYVEVWVEKEALSGVIERPCRRLRTPYMACRGYMSASAAWAAGQRFKAAAERGDDCILIHLGDHDPSGVDMTRDNRDRVELFSGMSHVDVKRIALNMDQVKRYSPPPNPAKLSDARAANYISEYGRTSWELDALEPRVLDDLITKSIREHINADMWNEDLGRENETREKLRKVHTHWGDVSEFIDTL